MSTPTPTQASDLSALESKVAQVLPTHSVDVLSSPSTGITLVRASAEVLAARRLAQETEGLAVSVQTEEDGREVWSLAPEVGPSQALKVEQVARQRGLTLLRWQPADRRAILAPLSETVRDVRERVASVLRCDPWDVRVSVEPREDGEPVGTVEIAGARWPAGDARLRMIREVIAHLPDGNLGWRVEDDPTADSVIVRWRKKPELPPMVALSDLLPERLDAAAWSTLPLGIDPDGEEAVIDLTAGPHTLIAGPTGSGKTVGLLTLVTGALARGHRLVLIDPTKAGLDFAALRPYATAWADDYASARVAIERVYAEVGRRKAVLKAAQEVKWSDLADDVREAEDIAPLLVLIDEYGSLALDATVPKGLDKMDPLVIEATELNAQKAVLKELVGRIAREARFVGIHLAIALQRPDVAVMGSGELRSNLTSAVQLAPPGKGVSSDALRMLFNADVVDAAAEQLALLDDGRSKGLAVVAAEGGSARGLRVAYSPMRDIPPLLAAAGVPEVEQPWDLSPEATKHGAERARVKEQARKAASASALDALDAPLIEDVVDFDFTPEPAATAEKGGGALGDDWGL